MATKTKLEAQNPLILRSQRLMEAFAKSDDERDFYLDRQEGFILYVDLDKPQEDLAALENELIRNPDRYVSIPKLTFYETKKIMEGFVNEKVYDIDTKEKLLEIIQSKEARENFIDFIYDHHSELEKWQQYYQERSRIRIIEWLRNNHFHFVFEEDLDLPKSLIDRLKKDLFEPKVQKDLLAARKTLSSKASSYYSNEALNPRPKRGRPPKQAAKLEIEPQISSDIYTTVPNGIRTFLFIPDTANSFVTFSSKFETEEELLASRRSHQTSQADLSLESLNQKLAALRNLSNRWLENSEGKKPAAPISRQDDEEEEEEEVEEEDEEIIYDEDDLEFSEENEDGYTTPLNGKAAEWVKKPAPATEKKVSQAQPKKNILVPKEAAKAPAKIPLKPTPKAATVKQTPPQKEPVTPKGAVPKSIPAKSVPAKPAPAKGKGIPPKAPLKAPVKKAPLPVKGKITPKVAPKAPPKVSPKAKAAPPPKKKAVVAPKKAPPPKKPAPIAKTGSKEKARRLMPIKKKKR